MCDWESHQHYPDTQYKPGLIGIPKRTNRCDHFVAMLLRFSGHEQSGAKVKAVEQGIQQHGQTHQAKKNNRQVVIWYRTHSVPPVVASNDWFIGLKFMYLSGLS